MKKSLKFSSFFAVCICCLFTLVATVNAEGESCIAVDNYSNLKDRKLYIPSLFANYHMTVRHNIGGAFGFCIESGSNLPPSSNMLADGCSESMISAKTKKALNYCDARGGCTNEQYLIAQVYAWGGDLKAAKEALQSYRGISVYATILPIEFEVSGIYAELEATSTAGDFICWAPYDNASYQRVATKRKGECSQVCPPGTEKAGTKLPADLVMEKGYETAVKEFCGSVGEDCYGYQIDLTGSLGICSDDNIGTTSSFSEVVGAADVNAAGSENGRKQDVNIGSGKYCALYCIETMANVTLPGGIANAITLGSAITWPTSDKTSSSKFGNMYPITFQGNKKCVIQVAPELTYGDSCNLDPVDKYGKYLDKLKEKYADNTNAGAKANEANGRRDGHSGGAIITALTAISNVSRLNLNNEEIRRKYSTATTYEGLTENSADAFFNQYLDIVNPNITTAKDNLKNVWENYCKTQKGGDSGFAADSETVCNGTKNPTTGVCNGTTETVYTCPEGSDRINDTTCKCTEEYAVLNDENTSWWKDTVDVWTALKGLIEEKHRKYKKYIGAYKTAVDLYHEIKQCADYTFNCSGDSCAFYNFETYAEMSYSDEGDDYGASYPLQIEENVNYSCDTCGQKIDMYETNQLVNSTNGYKFITETAEKTYLAGRIEVIKNKTMNIDTGTVVYSLPSGLYNYINKETNRYVMTKPTDANYIRTGITAEDKFLFSNLPTSYNNKVDTKYNLIIDNIKLGDKGQFTKGVSGVSIDTYTCHYTVKTDSDECLCPPGTKHSGVDLYQALLDSDGTLTCADAKEKYCDGDNVPKCEEDCVEDKYCSNDKTIKITACVNSGKSEADCEEKLCSKTYKCDNSTKHAGMDMTSCVQTRIVQGQTEANAIKYCNKTVCSLQNFAIYRTIDLQNPFPGKNWGISNGPIDSLNKVFNLDGGGRYPGYNWNGATVVKKLIHTTRDSVVDYDIYNQTPLYHFELDTATILNIREYNKDQKDKGGYNDFTLDCITDMSDSRLGTVCVSDDFVHVDDTRYGGDIHGNKSVCGGASNTTRLEDCLVTAKKLKGEE